MQLKLMSLHIELVLCRVEHAGRPFTLDISFDDGEALIFDVE